jgi:hypothetical protein
MARSATSGASGIAGAGDQEPGGGVSASTGVLPTGRFGSLRVSDVGIASSKCGQPEARPAGSSTTGTQGELRLLGMRNGSEKDEWMTFRLAR